MGTDLLDLSSIPGGGELATFDNDAIEAVTSGADFLPRIALMAALSKLVSDDKIAKGNFAMITGKESFVDLGSTFDALAICWHPKSLQIDGETITANYDHKSEEFQSIAAKSKTPNSGCMMGPEFLLWLPETNKFATYHFASASSRNEARNLIPLVKKRVTISSRKLSNKKFQWLCPLVVECSTPFEIPPLEEIVAKATKFLNPKVDLREKVEDTQDERPR